MLTDGWTYLATCIIALIKMVHSTECPAFGRARGKVVPPLATLRGATQRAPERSRHVELQGVNVELQGVNVEVPSDTWRLEK